MVYHVFGAPAHGVSRVFRVRYIRRILARSRNHEIVAENLVAIPGRVHCECCRLLRGRARHRSVRVSVTQDLSANPLPATVPTYPWFVLTHA